MASLWQHSAREIASLVRRREVSAVEATRAALDRIEAVDDAVRAFVRVDREGALARAAAIDRRRSAGEVPGPLAGVPVALKDNIAVAGWELTCASRVLRGYRSPFSAGAVERLLAADAVPVGQTNMDEFAMGSSCESSAFFATRNPWDPGRVPGGSSGGSAAAVAARAVPLALGSDTGGSIRQPAAFCGVVGVKPTYGRVSRWGLVAFASSLDQIGPLAGDVADAALLLSVIEGHDPRDSTSSPSPASGCTAALEDGVEGLRIGCLREVSSESLGADVAADWRAALRRLEELGAELVEVSVPSVAAAVSVYYVVANCEASANLARYDGVRYGHRTERDRSLDLLYLGSRSEGFGAEVKRRILLGTFALSSGYYDAYYARARAVQDLLRRELADALSEVDLLVTPTSPTAAFGIGERVEDPLAMYLSDVFTVPANLAGLPSVALPSGLDGEGLPLSIQLVGRPFGEAALLRAARAFERATRFDSRPPLALEASR
ncbi:MAG TPA: Asp-tRNA(Asn)/Glu-tRNA(Gln) amidotransferase subunit GatA [Thermoanaerobaculia bacterium]|nr:Asp-tRNA(Asn)/Glu-tRNA(Gln) amidotransferase subunit GatA [Thermoanaerobaculia bacterium]